MAAGSQRATCSRGRGSVADESREGLGSFTLDQHRPFFGADDAVAKELLREAHGLTKVLAAAYVDAGELALGTTEASVDTLNTAFVASAFNGIGSLIALAMFMQEREA